MNKKLKKALLVLLITLISFCMCSCEKKKDTLNINNVDDLNGHKIGVVVGSILDTIVSERIDNVEICYFQTVGDIVTALTERKIDAIVYDSGEASNIINENKEIVSLKEGIGEFTYAAIFNINNKSLCDDYNNFITSLEEKGSLKEIQNYWINKKEIKQIDYKSLENINGTLTIAACHANYPLTFENNNDYTGLELELIYLYCQEKGLKLEVKAYDFSGTLAAVSANKVDMAIAGIVKTKEREEQFLFSKPYASGSVSLLLLEENYNSTYTDINDLKGKTLAAVTGGVCGDTVKEAIGDIHIKYYNSITDMIEALKKKKIDGLAISDTELTPKLLTEQNLKIVETISEEEYGFIFPKTDEGALLRKEVDDFINQNQDLINEIYKNYDEEKCLRNLNDLQGEKGTINVAVSSALGEPTVYYKNGELIGEEITLIYEFAKAYGYKLNIADYSFDGMLQVVSASKVDFGGSTITITEERKESLLFSAPYNVGHVVIVMLGETKVEQKDFFNSIIDSFNKTFIKENRYLLFIDGVAITLLISFFSIVCGFILGVLLFIIYLKKNKIINRILDILGSLINDLPTIVLLMIFYYVVFSNSTIDSTWVSIVSFTVAFAFVILSILNTSLYAIDKGQFDGAYALGYSNLDTYRRIIIPQIIPIFLPLFKSNVVALIKSTSIVGYIAVQDLTKISDIVRTRTYEAFFPLIATTIIYILIIVLFKKIIDYIGNKINFEKIDKEKFLKGVKK